MVLGIDLTHYIRDIHACCQSLSLVQNIHKLLNLGYASILQQRGAWRQTWPTACQSTRNVEWQVKHIRNR